MKNILLFLFLVSVAHAAGTLSTNSTLNGTAGSGFLQMSNQSATPGTPTAAGRIYFDSNNRLRIVGNGLGLQAAPSAQPVSEMETALSFVGANSSGSSTKYAGIAGRIHTATAGSEKGELWFFVNDAGTYQPMGRITNDGIWFISPTAGVGRDGGGLALMTLARGDGADEALLNLQNIATPAIGNRAWMRFSALNDAGDGVEKQFAYIRMEVENAVAGSESGSLTFSAQNSGVENAYYRFNFKRWLWGQRTRISYKTADYSIGGSSFPVDYEDSYSHFTNNGAAGTIVISLPQGVDSGTYINVGSRYTFSVQEPLKKLSVKPYTSQKINSPLGLATDHKIASSSLGSSITLEYLGQNVWQAVSYVGTWSDDGT